MDLNIRGWFTQWSWRASGWAWENLPERWNKRKRGSVCMHLITPSHWDEAVLLWEPSVFFQCHHPISISKKWKLGSHLGQLSSLGSSNFWWWWVCLAGPISVLAKCPFVPSSLNGCKVLVQFLVFRLVATFAAVFEGGTSEAPAAPTYCNAISMEASADPTGRSEDGLSLTSCPKLGWGGQAFIIPGSSVTEWRLPKKKAWTLVKQIFLAEILPKAG